MNLLPSITRTAVPFIVALIAGIVAHVGLKIDDTAVADAVSGAIGFAYYALVRVLEQRYPALTVLLGSTQQPAGYTSDTPAAAYSEGVDDSI